MSGRRNTSSGRAWEAQIAASAALYRRQGLAMVRQAHADRKRGPGLVDFAGTLQGGRAFLADAKRTAGTRWAASSLAPHQAAQLRDAWGLQAVAGVLLCTPDGWAWLDWPTLADGGSFTIDDGVRIHPGPTGLPDWLPAVLRGC